MDLGLEKLEAAQARLAAAGDRRPDLDHLLVAMQGFQRAQALVPRIPLEAALRRRSIPAPDASVPLSIPLFQSLHEFVQAGALALGSVGLFYFSGTLARIIGSGLGSYGCVRDSSANLIYLPNSVALEQAARAVEEGSLGSLPVLQLLAASRLQQYLGQCDQSWAEAADMATVVMQALWGVRPARALRKRLERQSWVPQLPPAAATSGKQHGGAPRASNTSAERPQRQAQQQLQRDLQQHCGVGGQAALDAVWVACCTLRLAAVGRMDAPSQAHAETALCDAQALLDCCADPAAVARHLSSAAQAVRLAFGGCRYWGLDWRRRQAMLALLHEALARADAQQCDYSAARAAFCLAFTAAQLAVLDEQLPGCVGDDMSAPEAAELAQRSRKAAAKVATYWPRLKPWAPAGLQALYQSTVARAVRLGAPAPPWLGVLAAASPQEGFPACSACREPSLHLRRCGACRSPGAQYCSQRCQQTHWKTHKAACKQARAAAASGSEQ